MALCDLFDKISKALSSTSKDWYFIDESYESGGCFVLNKEKMFIHSNFTHYLITNTIGPKENYQMLDKDVENSLHMKVPAKIIFFVWIMLANIVLTR